MLQNVAGWLMAGGLVKLKLHDPNPAAAETPDRHATSVLDAKGHAKPARLQFITRHRPLHRDTRT